MTPRGRRAALVATGVLVLGAVGAGVWWQAASRPPTAEQAAAAYLRALESGDGDAVAEVVPGLVPSAVRAFDGATALITDAELRGVEPEGDDVASAEVSFRLAGENRAALLTLTLRDGRWGVDESGLGRLTATSSLGSFVAVGGQMLATGEEALLPPAEYEVSAVPTELLEGAATVTVLPGGESAPAVAATRRPEAEDAARAQLDARLERCTAPSSDSAGDAAARPAAGCGIRIPWGTEFRSIDDVGYRIERAPALELADDTFRATGGVLVATVHGVGQDGTQRTVTYRTSSWSVRGDVDYTADDIILTPW